MLIRMRNLRNLVFNQEIKDFISSRLSEVNTSIDVPELCLPYLGYPRSLNAIACINKAAEGVVLLDEKK